MFNLEKSKAMLEKTREFLAGGVSSDIRARAKPFPIFLDRGQGSRIYDVDGNEYIDYLLGYGALILGHRPACVLEAVKGQLDRGSMFGGGNETEYELSKKLVEVIPCAELVRYNCSGSEAIHGALRVARAYTGRSKLIKFEGHYHGWYDSVYVSVMYPEKMELLGPRENPRKILGSGGQPESILEDLIVLPWNDADIVEEVIRARKNEIAAVITEPVMGSLMATPPRQGYLERLREITRDNGVLLIFDEVQTGFALALGGAQEYYGVIPDMSIFGKAVGGGFPISGFAGRRDVMDVITARKIMHCGTYNGHPVSVAAALATVTELQRNKETIYPRLRGLGRRLIDGMNEMVRKAGIKGFAQGPGPMFQICLRALEPDKVKDFRTAWGPDDAYNRFVGEAVGRGIYTMPAQGGSWHLSAAHTEEDIDRTLEIVEEALGVLKK